MVSCYSFISQIHSQLIFTIYLLLILFVINHLKVILYKKQFRHEIIEGGIS